MAADISNCFLNQRLTVGIKLRLYQIANLTPSTLSATGGREEYVFNSYFFRGEYNFDEKYYVEGSYRRDGSSRFSPKHRWANFYAFGLIICRDYEQYLAFFRV